MDSVKIQPFAQPLHVNLVTGLEAWHALYSLLSIPILYGVLQIGRENKAWPQLE